MKKRSKLMLGLSAMLLATAGVAATGTFAWFTATNANITPGAAATGTLTSSTAAENLGAFTITPEIVADFSDPVAVALTDSYGKTYIMNASNTSVKTDVSAQNATKYATVELKLRIEYDGALTDVNDIKALWAQAAGTITFTITETTTYTGSSPSAVIVGALASEQPLYGKTKGTHYGLKFQKDSAPAANGTENSWISNAAYVPATGLAKALAANALDNPGTFAAGHTHVNTADYQVLTDVVATYYVGIIGIDGVVQTETDSYGFSVAVANS